MTIKNTDIVSLEAKLPISFTDAFSVDRQSFEEFLASVVHVFRLKLVSCKDVVPVSGMRDARLLVDWQMGR